MITPSFFDQRWSWYAPILERGDDPVRLLEISARDYPLRFATPDAREAIPYALHPELSERITGAIQRLVEYARRYWLEGEKVSLHKLPQLNAQARARVGELRKWYPHLPVALVHHWCADPAGAEALFSTCRVLWRKAWREEERAHVPWVRAVNVLVLGLVSQAVRARLKGADERLGHVVLSIAGHLFVQETLAFLRERAGGEVDQTRLASYEAMMIPITPMAFTGRDVPPPLLRDDPALIRLYGLEPELVPRMRKLREKLGRANERGMLNLLARDRLGNHLLKRTWARLSFWELAVRTREGRWMRYVFDARLLDRFLLRGEPPEGPLLHALQAQAKESSFARWVLACVQNKGAAREQEGPWVVESRVLDAFRVFEEDARVEAARRAAERIWADRREAIAGRLRGAEAERRLAQAWREGEIVWFTEDLEAPLQMRTTPEAFAQACLAVSWSEYLAELCALAAQEAEAFLAREFLPQVLEAISGRDEVYLEAISGAGCLLRGEPEDLLHTAFALRARLHALWRERTTQPERAMPPCAMAISALGDWLTAQARWNQQTVRLRFSMAVAQAQAMLAHDCGVGRLIALRDAKRGAGLGAVRAEQLAVPEGAARCLYNNGIALTPAVANELVRSCETRGRALEVRIPAEKAKALLAGAAVPAAGVRLIVLRWRQDEEPVVLRPAGKPCVGGADLELYEAVVPDHPAGAKLLEAARAWLKQH